MIDFLGIVLFPQFPTVDFSRTTRCTYLQEVDFVGVVNKSLAPQRLGQIEQ